MGLNISKSGISPSVRTEVGTISSRGFSIRTGIRGLSYRQSFGNSSDGAGFVVLLLVVFVALLPVFIQMVIGAVQIAWVLVVSVVRIFIVAPYNVMLWAIQNAGDYINYRRKLRTAVAVFRRRNDLTIDESHAALPESRDREH
jgi:hypothetical protein